MIFINFFFSRIPFDSKNPPGFLIAFTLQYIIISYELYVIACVLSLAVGAYLFAIAATNEIESGIHDINESTQIKPKNRLNFLQQFSIFISVHSTVKQLSKSIFSIHSFFFLNFQSFVFTEWQLVFRMFINRYLWYYFHYASEQLPV